MRFGPQEEAAGGTCERCGSTVTKRNLRQWMLKITAYADRLLEDLQKLDWSDKGKRCSPTGSAEAMVQRLILM